MAYDVLRLPNYPSTSFRKGLSASQLAELNHAVASTLTTVLTLPADKRDIPSTRNFLSSFCKDSASQILQDLIWKEEVRITNDEKLIQKRSLQLAEKLALSHPGLDVQSLIDLSVIYAHNHSSRLRPVFKAALQTDPSLPQVISSDLIPGFNTLLLQPQGLYSQRKIAECICCFLRGANDIPDLIRPFAHNKEFLISLATSYDIGMTTVAATYGGTPGLTAGISALDREPDEWERIWVETKVCLLDSFHIVLTTLLDDLASCPPGPLLAAEAERTFDIIFTLLESPSSSSSTPLDSPIPFLNQSLLADYQQSYSLSHTLATALKNAQEKDVRLDLLESTLAAFDHNNHSNASDGSNQRKPKNAGALKILLRSSGIQPGIDNLGTRTTQSQGNTEEPTLGNDFQFNPPVYGDASGNSSKLKGKSWAAAPPSDPDLDIKTTQVLDILPDTPADYVKLLLAHDRYGRNPEKVVEALLEGTAISREDLELDWQASAAALEPHIVATESIGPTPGRAEVYSVDQRRNIFDEETLDISLLRFGKKSAGDEVLRDRTFIEEMKADILRRAEAISDDEDDEDTGFDAYGEPKPTATSKKGKEKELDPPASRRPIDVGPDDDDEDIIGLRVTGDGEDSSGDDDEEEEEEEEAQTPETIVELAFLRDPKIFERDSATRRSKARIDLRAQTGWDDGQIEGWKVMMDRNPNQKERLMEKYAFRGNEKGLEVRAGGSGRGRGGRGRGRGAPRGGGGRGRGGGAGGEGGGEASARERAWKDKNKASRGNHNRKRGHDKKMARAGPGPSA